MLEAPSNNFVPRLVNRNANEPTPIFWSVV